MFRWVLSNETEELAELLSLTINIFRSEFKNKGSDVMRDEIERSGLVSEFRRNDHDGVEEYSFYFQKKLKEFFFHIIDERKIDERKIDERKIDERKGFGGFGLHITAEDQRYYGFSLYCDLLTGIATTNAADSLSGKRATKKAQKLCNAFARKYAA
jgi:hypothetical protein